MSDADTIHFLGGVLDGREAPYLGGWKYVYRWMDPEGWYRMTTYRIARVDGPILTAIPMEASERLAAR